MHVPSKFRFFFFFVFIFVFSLQGFSQANKKALEYLLNLRQPTLEISTQFLAYTKLVLLEGLSKKSIRNKKMILNEVLDGKARISKNPTYNGQDRLFQAYFNYFVAMENYLNRLPTIEIETIDFDSDSAKKFQEVQIQQLVMVLKASQNVKEGFDMFCSMNRVIGFKTSGSLSVKQKDAIKLVSYAVKVSNSVMEMRRLNQLFFNALLEDTGAKAEMVRKEIVAQSSIAKESLLAIPGFPAEPSLKRTGMHNVRLYGISASKMYIQLLDFRKRELAFVQKSLEFKEKRGVSDFDKDVFYEEILNFAALVKLNRAEIKRLNLVRDGLEKSFDSAFFQFVENRFIL